MVTFSKYTPLFPIFHEQFPYLLIFLIFYWYVTLYLQYICSYVLWPLAFLMGIEKEDCRKVAELIGVKIMVNEFVAFEELAVLTDNSGKEQQKYYNTHEYE